MYGRWDECEREPTPGELEAIELEQAEEERRARLRGAFKRADAGLDELDGWDEEFSGADAFGGRW